MLKCNKCDYTEEEMSNPIPGVKIGCLGDKCLGYMIPEDTDLSIMDAANVTSDSKD